MLRPQPEAQSGGVQDHWLCNNFDILSCELRNPPFMVLRSCSLLRDMSFNGFENQLKTVTLKEFLEIVFTPLRGVSQNSASHVLHPFKGYILLKNKYYLNPLQIL